MATHSSILAWRIPWTEEPGGLQPMGLQRTGSTAGTEHTRELRSSESLKILQWNRCGRTPTSGADCVQWSEFLSPLPL